MAGKRFAAAAAAREPGKAYELADGVRLVRANAKAKFDETIELAVRLGIDVRHADQMVRGVVRLPNGSGRRVRVAVFAQGEQADAAKAAGADLVGAEELIRTVESGTIEFDRCIATPDMMPKVAALGKILGPRGLMPNPRSQTVNEDAAAAVKAAKGGALEFRADKGGIVHAVVGKASFSDQQLMENIFAVMHAIKRAKPSGSKGVYVKRIALCSTMGPSLMLSPTSFSRTPAAEAA